METFEATIEEANRGGAVVRVPAEVVEALGGTGRVAVQATFDGIPYQGSVVSMGGAKVLGILKSIRSELGKEPGDVITVTLQRDDAERTVTVPGDLRARLDETGLTRAFDELSYSRRREHVNAVESAKQPETRARRIAAVIDRLRG